MRYSFFQGIISWQEQGGSSPPFTPLLADTLLNYLSWDLADQTVFRITQFLAAGFLKVSQGRLLKHSCFPSSPAVISI